MLPVLIWLAVLAAFGGAVARITAGPIGYLYFAMPAWNLLTVPLQQLTVRAVGVIAPAIGLPATVSGTAVSFPNGSTFVVTMACSGVGFLTQGLAVAALLGELEEANTARRLRLVGGMALVAIVTNWLRVLLLLVMGYSAGMDNIIVAHFHLEFGYVLFVVVLVAFVWFTTRPATPPPTEATAQADRRPILRGCFAAILVLIAGPALSLLSTKSATREPQLTLPAAHDLWSGPMPNADGHWRPVFVGQHAQQQGLYQDARGRRVEALAVGYSSQGQGHELINEGNSILGNGGLSAKNMAFAEAGDTTYLELETIDGSGSRSVIWSVYDIGGRTFVVPLLSQLWYGLQALIQPTYSLQFVFRTQCDPTCAGARDTLRDFVRRVGWPRLTDQGAVTTTFQSLPTGRSEEKRERS